MNNEFLINLLPIFPGVLLLITGLILMLRSSFSEDTNVVNLYATGGALLACLLEFAILISNCSACSQGAFSGGAYGILASDALTSFFRFLFLLAFLFSIVNLCFDKLFQDKKSSVLIILFFASVGGYFLISAREVITWYLSLELMSLSSYVLVAAHLSDKKSSEAAIKYFVAGALGSALILFGLVCFYGFSGSGNFTEIYQAISVADTKFIALSSIFLLSGLTFKLGLFPFHYWVADVYQGAARSITVFLSSAVKVAIVAATFFICRDILVFFQEHLVKFWWVVLALSSLLANIMALRQKSLSRLVAYSSIANTAYLSVGFLHLEKADFKLALLNYLVIYILMTLISFISISVLQSDDKKSLLGLSKRSPFLTAVILINLLALAGLPPLLVGLFAKIYVLKAALSAKYVGLSIIFIIGFVIGCYYYLKLIAAMFTESENSASLIIPVITKIILFILAGTLVYYTFFPVRLYDFLGKLV